MIQPRLLDATRRSALGGLQAAGRVQPVAVDLARSERFLALAAEQLAEAHDIGSPSTRFSVAYDCCHSVGEALLAAYGYRTAPGSGQHVVVGDILRALFPDPPPSEAADDFDGLRAIRNGIHYRAVPVGQAQAGQAQEVAAILLQAARELLS